MAKGELEVPHLWVYDKNGNMVEDAETPFKRVGAKKRNPVCPV